MQVLFLGWAQDANTAMHLHCSSDVIVFHSYHDSSFISEQLAKIDGQNIDVLAWSYGVYMAANLLPKVHVTISSSVAVNGTCTPMHKLYGIAPKVTNLTLRTLSEASLEKFNERMLGEKFSDMSQKLSKRTIQSVKEELEYLIALFSETESLPNIFKKAYVGCADVIFPHTAQLAYWSTQTETEVVTCPEDTHFSLLYNILVNNYRNGVWR